MEYNISFSAEFRTLKNDEQYFGFEHLETRGRAKVEKEKTDKGAFISHV